MWKLRKYANTESQFFPNFAVIFMNMKKDRFEKEIK